MLPAIRKTGGYMAAKPDSTPEGDRGPALLVANDTMKRQREAHRGTFRRERGAPPQGAVRRRGGASGGHLPRGRDHAKMLRQNGVDIGQNRYSAGCAATAGWADPGANRITPTQRAMDMGAVPHQRGGGHAQRRPRHGHPHAQRSPARASVAYWTSSSTTKGGCSRAL